MLDCETGELLEEVCSVCAVVTPGDPEPLFIEAAGGGGEKARRKDAFFAERRMAELAVARCECHVPAALRRYPASAENVIMGVRTCAPCFARRKPRVWKARDGWWARACDPSARPLTEMRRGPFREWEVAIGWALARRWGAYSPRCAVALLP